MLMKVLLLFYKMWRKSCRSTGSEEGYQSGVYGLVSKRQTLAAPCMAALKLPQICRDGAASAFVIFITLSLIGWIAPQHAPFEASNNS
jgi:hypothetical protein